MAAYPRWARNDLDGFAGTRSIDVMSAGKRRSATINGNPRAYHGPWDDIRPRITDTSNVNYTWFESHLLPAPWHRGRVVLIGDAAHACPPTLAQGAAQAFEDAAVLAELLLETDHLDEDLWESFMSRRFARARKVVNASLQLAQWLLDHERGDVPGLMAEVAHMLSTPA